MIKKCILRRCSDNVWPLVLMVQEKEMDIHRGAFWEIFQNNRNYLCTLILILLLGWNDQIVPFQRYQPQGQQSPPIPSKNSGHNNAFLKHDHRQMSHLQTTFFNNCTNQLNVSYYTLFLCTHTINYLNCRNYKIGKSDQYNGWVDHSQGSLRYCAVIRDTFKS